MGYGQTVGRAHFVNEKTAVEMVNLMLPGTRCQVFCLYFYFLTFESVSLILDLLSVGDLAHNTWETQTPFFFIQFPCFFYNYRIDKYLFHISVIINVDNKQTDRPPYLRS